MSDQAALDATAASGPIVLVISSDVMGRGDDDLGRVLLRNHLHVLAEASRRPDILVFYNSGVKLATEDSPALDDLRALAARGTTILLCGTCLGHFGLKDRVAVGESSNMYAITEAMLGAGKVITL